MKATPTRNCKFCACVFSQNAWICSFCWCGFCILFFILKKLAQMYRGGALYLCLHFSFWHAISIYFSIFELVPLYHKVMLVQKRLHLLLLMLTNCWLCLTSQLDPFRSIALIAFSTQMRYVIGSATETERVGLMRLLENHVWNGPEDAETMKYLLVTPFTQSEGSGQQTGFNPNSCYLCLCVALPGVASSPGPFPLPWGLVHTVVHAQQYFVIFSIQSFIHFLIHTKNTKLSWK